MSSRLVPDRGTGCGIPGWALAISVALVSAAVFVLDLTHTSHLASAVPYLLAVLVSLRSARRSMPLVVATVVSALTVFGFLLPEPPTDDFVAALGNRGIALVSVWAVALLGHRLGRQEDEARRGDVRLRAVLEVSPDLILTLDGDGRIETANPAAADVFGASPAGLRGRPLVEFLWPAGDLPNDPESSPAIDLVVSGGVGSGTATVGQDDDPRTVLWKFRALDGCGRRLAVGLDVTELLDAQQRAVRSERLAAIGQTLATLSHEAKNELVAFKMGLEHLGNCWDDRDAATEMIDDLHDAQGRLWRLFEDVRGYAAPIRLRPAAVSLSEVWQQVWENLPGLPGRDARLIDDVGPGLDRLDVCIADSFRLEQVFRNLFENALAACPEPVLIRVTCSATDWRGEPALLVTVRDNGPGLSEEARGRVFEPFFTTKQHGTGLGLPICHRILEAHHGDLSVGPPGPGAEFRLILPKAALPVVRERVAV